MSDNPPSDLLRTLTSTQIVAAGWAVETGREPKSPDRVVTFTDTGGEPANPKYLLDFPGVQIRVRGAPNGYKAAYAHAKLVKDLVLGVDSQDVADDRLVSVTMISDVQYLGNDEDERPMFSINFRLITEPGTAAESNRLSL